MSRESLVFLLGLIVLLAPLIGVPPQWKDYALLAIGALLMLIGLSLRRGAYYRRLDRGNGEIGNGSFVESQPDNQPTLLDHVPEEAEAEK